MRRPPPPPCPPASARSSSASWAAGSLSAASPELAHILRRAGGVGSRFSALAGVATPHRPGDPGAPAGQPTHCSMSGTALASKVRGARSTCSVSTVGAMLARPLWRRREDDPSHCCRYVCCRCCRAGARLRTEPICRGGFSVHCRVTSAAEQAGASASPLIGRSGD